MQEKLIPIDIPEKFEIKSFRYLISNYIPPKYDQNTIIDVEINEFNENFHLIKNNQNLNILKIGNLPRLRDFEQLSLLPSLEVIEFSGISEKNQNILDDILNSLYNFKSLKKLTIHNSDLLSLPSSICKLTNLIELRVYFTKIENLPHNIGNLTNLEDLDIIGNNLKSLPKSFFKLKKLKTLSIDNELLHEISFLKENMQNLKEVLNMDKIFENILKRN